MSDAAGPSGPIPGAGQQTAGVADAGSGEPLEPDRPGHGTTMSAGSAVPTGAAGNASAAAGPAGGGTQSLIAPAAGGADARNGITRPEGFIARLLGWGAARPTDPGPLRERPEQQVNGSALPGLSNLRHMRVEDVAIPKSEIAAVAAETGLPDLIALFRESGFTRLPVYEGTLDMPLGLVHLKDVALRYGFNGGSDGFSLQALVRPLLFAPPSMPLGVLLQKMQSQRMHMALVIDEYGGTDGLVTIEDLIEQVIGEIEDEHDVDEATAWTREKSGCYLALARASMQEFEAAIGRRLSAIDADEEVDTLGGLVFLLSGRVPARGEVVKHPDGTEFEVVEADPRRIKRLRIRLAPAKPENA